MLKSGSAPYVLDAVTNMIGHIASNDDLFIPTILQVKLVSPSGYLHLPPK